MVCKIRKTKYYFFSNVLFCRGQVRFQTELAVLIAKSRHLTAARKRVSVNVVTGS